MINLPLRHVLITGAGGFVPRCIVNALLKRGVQVSALDLAFDTDLVSAWRTYGDQIRLYEQDANTLPDVDVDAVVHGAAITVSPEEIGQTPEDYLRANLTPLLKVLEWAKDHRSRALVMSSSAIFRATDGKVTEDMPPSPTGAYASAKAFTESFTAMLKEAYGRDVVCIRLSSIYGLDEIARASRPRISIAGKYVQQAVEKGIIDVYSPDDAREWTFAPDVGEVVARLLSVPSLAHSLYNVASQQKLSNRMLADTIKTAMPDVKMITHEETEPNTALITRRGVLDSTRMMRELGWSEWTPFEDGIRQVIQSVQRRIHAHTESPS